MNGHLCGYRFASSHASGVSPSFTGSVLVLSQESNIKIRVFFYFINCFPLKKTVPGLSNAGMRVRILVGKLRSHQLCGTTDKKIKNTVPFGPPFLWTRYPRCLHPIRVLLCYCVFPDLLLLWSLSSK